jgi:hypothetical protein
MERNSPHPERNASGALHVSSDGKRKMASEQAFLKPRPDSNRDPFITSYGRLSPRVTASHLRRVLAPNLADWW